MVSRKTLKKLGFIINFGSYAGFIPYSFIGKDTLPLAIEIGFGFTAVGRMFLAVIYRETSDFVASISILLILLKVFRGFAQVHDVSKKALESWSSLDSKWFRKFRRTCRPISVSVGGFYNADKQLVITLLDIIVNQTVGLVVGYSA